MNCPVTFSTGDIQYKDVTYKVPRKLCLPQIDAATILESGCIFSNAKPSDGHPWDHCNDPNTASGFSGQSADRMSSAGSSDGKKYVSFIFEYNDSFQHIVFDSLPKTWQLCDYFKANKDLGILVTSDLQRELMQLACELPLERFTVRPFKASMPLSAASIAVPHYFPDSPDVRQDIPPFASFQSFGPQTGPGRKAIYMPRRQNSGGNRAKRHVTNDDEVVAALRERFGNDFVEFTPSDWHTDRAVLKEAGWIIAPHGGAESNMVFCPKGTTVIEFLPLTKIKKSGQNERACFFGLAHALGFRYVAVEPDSFSFDGDMTVPIDKLKEVLRQ